MHYQKQKYLYITLLATALFIGILALLNYNNNVSIGTQGLGQFGGRRNLSILNGNSPNTQKNQSLELLNNIRTKFQNVVLIVQFNKGQLQQDVILNGISKYFKYVVLSSSRYLGEFSERFPVIYCKEYTQYYGCTQQVIHMYPDAVGYFTVHFDVLPSLWLMLNNRLDVSWSTYFEIAKLNSTTEWVVWKDNIERLKSMHHPNQPWFDFKGQICPGTLEEDESQLIVKGLCDIYYVPARLKILYLKAAKMFSDNDIHLELACASIHTCINGGLGNVHWMSGIFDWQDQGNFACKWDLNAAEFVHPIWFSNEFHSKKLATVFDLLGNGSIVQTGSLGAEWARC